MDKEIEDHMSSVCSSFNELFMRGLMYESRQLYCIRMQLSVCIARRTGNRPTYFSGLIRLLVGRSKKRRDWVSDNRHEARRTLKYFILSDSRAPWSREVLGYCILTRKEIRSFLATLPDMFGELYKITP